MQMTSAVQALWEDFALWLTNLPIRKTPPAKEIQEKKRPLWGWGGRITVYPVSEYQSRAKAPLKCSSIVCLSSFVCLTNEVYSNTGWETKREGDNPTMAAGATGQLIFAQQLLWQTSNYPLKKRGQLSPHKWLRCKHINPGLTPRTYPYPPPSSPLSAPQIPSLQDNCQDASWQHVTFWRSSRELLWDCGVCMCV